MKKINFYRFFLLILFTMAFTSSLYSKAHNSSQAHEGSVTALSTYETWDSYNNNYISGGEDGFLTDWTSDGKGDHYQVGDLQIKIIAKNPINQNVAIYETNGVNIHRVSLWNIKTNTRIKSKRFSNAVTSLSFSEKGRYIIIGTSAVNQLYIMDSNLNQIVRKLNVGIISAVRTGSSEKSVMLYSPSGNITYFDMTKWSLLAKMNCEAMLENPVIFGAGEYKNNFLAGVKNNVIFVIDANSGTTIAQYQVNNPILMTSRSQNEDGLYYISNNGRNWTLNLIRQEDLFSHFESNSSPLSAPAPLPVKNFNGLKSNETITAACKTVNTVILGTTTGNIYKMSSAPESEMYTLVPSTEELYEKILAETACNEDFLFLTKQSIFRSSYETGSVDRVGINSGHTNIAYYNGSAILWTKNSSKSVQIVKLASGSTETPGLLFSPSAALQKLTVSGDKIIYVQGNSSVAIYDLIEKNNRTVFTGTAVQDAVLYDENNIYIAKTSSAVGDSPLVNVNLTTGETAPIRMAGNVVYSLSYNQDIPDSPLYGVVLASAGSQTKTLTTRIFSLDLSSKIVTYLFTYRAEDAEAWTLLKEGNIYTNIGQSSIHSVNLESKATTEYERSASLPENVAAVSGKVAILNKDGSISWYNPSSPSLLNDWYLMTDGNWFAY